MISPADRVRAALAAFAASVQPRPALSLIRDRTRKNAAPADTGAAPNPTAVKEPKDMDSIPRQAQQLRPDDIITRHPDHPGKQVWYRVAKWPRKVSHAQVIVDYTARSEQVNGQTFGVLILDVDQECQVVPAHSHGGQA